VKGIQLTIRLMNPTPAHVISGPSLRPCPDDVIADLRTDHAGETGAVCIYEGILRFSRDPGVRAFATRHLETERQHLRHIDAWLPGADRSRLLPLWRMAGWLTGAVPALLGPRAVYATVQAVETFVDQHYAAQVQKLESHANLQALRRTLLECQTDELTHRDEAAEAMGAEAPGAVLRLWCWLVGAGSRAAVAVCHHV
jgi:ubiquinone biosynthesis monooxygenase Coq7